MDSYRVQQLKDFYLSELTGDIIPFWQKHSIDLEQGGFLHHLDREGKLLSTDKGGWAQARGVWTYATLIREVENRKEWLIAARNGVRFIREKLRRRSDGRVFHQTTREGKPLSLLPDPVVEAYTAMGLAAYTQVSGDRRALEEARELYALFFRLLETREPPLNREVRPVKELSAACLTLQLCQTLRQADPENLPAYTNRIDETIDGIFRCAVKPELQAFLSSTGPEGERLEGPQGRCMEAALSFDTIGALLEEGAYRQDRELIRKVQPLLDWCIDLFWDRECGGLYSYIDIDGRQPAQLEWDMKIWRSHCAAAYAFLLARTLAGDPRYETWFETIQEYAWDRFPDREKGEWFGYLRRDGTVQMDLKGNEEKGLSSLPRFLIKTYGLLKTL